MTTPLDPRWIVAQIGAREHYAIARGMARTGRLVRLYTDVWWRTANDAFRCGPAFARRLAGRWAPDIPGPQVTAFNWSFISGRLNWRGEDIYQRCLRQGALFSEKVLRHLSTQAVDPERDAYFGYASASLELLSYFADRGHVTVLDQMDPGNDEHLLQNERRSWPGWEERPRHRPDAYYRRVAEEWKLAKYIMVNSSWSRSSLVSQGVPSEKIMVVPLAYEPGGAAIPPREHRAGPLRVLWLGSVTLRKGIQYLVEAARCLAETNVRFRVVGGIHVARRHLDESPPNVEFAGPCTRSEIAREYGQADVFVLPTISDGFAITQLEAMHHGLPVITTPNCGDVVENGGDGFIVPARDGECLARAIRRLDEDRDLLAAMSRAAQARAAEFSISAVFEKFRQEYRRVERMSGPGGTARDGTA